MGVRAPAWTKHWAARSLLFNGAGSLLDWVTLFLLVKVLGAPTVVGTLAGLTLGCSLSFLLNRRYAFRSNAPATGQLVRFVVGMGALMALHALCVSALVDHLGVALAIAKVSADVCIMATGQLLVLRHFVFAAPKPLPGAVAATAQT